ncbi:MAG: hypothetical protein LBU68_02200, partial [Rickettsiales bacterium]|nr:hypothetical protein [Rickettsiales bacterium]
MISIKKVRKAITHTITLMYLRKWIAKEIKEFKQYIKHMNLPRFDKVVLNTGSVPDKSVLICEPYFGHSECFTAWTKYFQDLGYNVDIITRYEHFYDNPFCRTKKPPRMFYGSLSMLKKWLKNENISKYDYVFFATHVRFDTFPNKLLLDYLGFTPNAKYGCLFIDHMPNIFFKEFNEVNLVRQNRIFALSDIPEMPQLNSHYFYNVPRHRSEERRVG